MHVLLIDAHIVFSSIYRAMSSECEPDVSDFYSNCLSSVLKSVKVNQPTHVLFCLDDMSRSWRRELMPGYRGDRFILPSSFEVFLPRFLRKLKEEGVASLSISDSESYDIIGTISKKLNEVKPDAKVTVLGTDKRLYSLFTDGFTLYYPYSRYPDDVRKDLSWFVKKEGVSVDSWLGCLSLSGDSSKGIVGVPGVGLKKSKKLICDFGSIENLYEERSLVEGGVGNSIRDYIEYVMSVTYKVCSLRSDLNLGLKISDMRYSALR